MESQYVNEAKRSCHLKGLVTQRLIKNNGRVSVEMEMKEYKTQDLLI